MYFHKLIKSFNLSKMRPHDVSFLVKMFYSSLTIFASTLKFLCGFKFWEYSSLSSAVHLCIFFLVFLAVATQHTHIFTGVSDTYWLIGVAWCKFKRRKCLLFKKSVFYNPLTGWCWRTKNLLHIEWILNSDWGVALEFLAAAMDPS